MATLMTANTLDQRKGAPKPYCLDYSAEVEDGVTVEAGMCCHLNEDGKYELGVGTLAVMPLFPMFPGSSPHAQNLGLGTNPDTDKGAYVATLPAGKLVALVGSGAFELLTTQYSGADLPPNTPLTSPLTGGNAGKLVEGTLYTDMIVGLASSGISVNAYGRAALAFWTNPVYPN